MSASAKPRSVTGRCVFCGKFSVVEIADTKEDQEGFSKWVTGEAVQVAFPHWSADKRETLRSGSHPECFDEAHLPDDVGQCFDHMWPEELTFDARCERCGLKFGEWSEEFDE